MENQSIDMIRTIVKELRSNPRRFQRAGGYQRLLSLLEEGYSPEPVKELLREDSSFVGDVLWTVCELDNVAPYVEDAALHMGAADRGTAGYAVEVVLRGAQDSAHLRAALSLLESAPAPVREHAVFVLASQGLARVREIFLLGNWEWAARIADDALSGPLDLEGTLKPLVDDSRAAHQLVGLTLATLAAERDERAVQIVEESRSEWARDLSVQLRRMFQHRWPSRPSPG
jgi:hypothetical protein